MEVDTKANDKAGGGAAVRMAERMKENVKANLMDMREQERFERQLLKEGLQGLRQGYHIDGSEGVTEAYGDYDSEGFGDSPWNASQVNSKAVTGSSSRRNSSNDGRSGGGGSSSVSSSGWVTASESGRSRSLTDVFRMSGGKSKGKQRIRL